VLGRWCGKHFHALSPGDAEPVPSNERVRRGEETWSFTSYVPDDRNISRKSLNRFAPDWWAWRRPLLTAGGAAVVERSGARHQPEAVHQFFRLANITVQARVLVQQSLRTLNRSDGLASAEANRQVANSVIW